MSKSTATQVLFPQTPDARVQRLRIEVRRGPDKGQGWDLDVEPVRIGTSEGCDVLLTDAAVSGVHAELRRTPMGVQLRDLGSTNGTFVDGRRIQGLFANGRTDLTLGQTELRLLPLDHDTPLELASDDRFGELLGKSVPMRAAFARLKRVAQTDTTVLIAGETGTGKELAAAAVRDHSSRADGPLVVLDCGALPPNLVESELFGHERGAFTGAERSRPGAFERASGGTIFLDEIGELPLSLQPALLGVLERREARRVGGQKPIPVDVRVVTATNRDLAAEVTRGAFRADLYYRLAVVEVRMPPLRERSDDIPMLVDAFLAQMRGPRPTLSPDTLQELQRYSWPGNVRELRNVIERAALLAEPPKPPNGASLPPQQAASNEAVTVDVRVPFKEQKGALIARFESAYVQELLASTGGNVAKAARQAGIDRMYLYKLMGRYGLDAPSRDR